MSLRSPGGQQYGLLVHHGCCRQTEQLFFRTNAGARTELKFMYCGYGNESLIKVQK